MRKTKIGKGFKSFESRSIKAKHYRITNNMIESEAWNDLSIFDRDLYHFMKSKYNSANENNISCTYEEGKRLMSKASFTKAIDSLINHGFIKLIENGRILRKPNIYGFSDLWQKYPNIDIVPRLKREKTETQKSNSPKGKKEISARLKMANETRSNVNQSSSQNIPQNDTD